MPGSSLGSLSQSEPAPSSHIMADGNYSQVTRLLSFSRIRTDQTFIAVILNIIKSCSVILIVFNLLQYNMDGSHVNEETVTHLRQRLNVMREIVKVFSPVLYDDG